MPWKVGDISRAALTNESEGDSVTFSANWQESSFAGPWGKGSSMGVVPRRMGAAGGLCDENVTQSTKGGKQIRQIQAAGKV